MSYVRDISLLAWDGTRENCFWAGEAASGLNIYAYAGGDPINGADPSGLAQGDGAFRDGQEGSAPEGLGGSQSAGGVGVGGYGGGNAGGTGSPGAPGHSQMQASFDQQVAYDQSPTGLLPQPVISQDLAPPPPPKSASPTRRR